MEKSAVSFAKLIDWVEGRLSAQEAQQVAEYVAQSAEAAENVAWLQQFIGMSEQIVLRKMPTAVRAKVTERFEQQAAPRRRPGFWERLQAALSFDSWQQPALVGLRSGGTSQSRQLVYSCERADIALHIEPAETADQMLIMGQIFPFDESEPEMFSVQLLHHLQEEGLLMADQLGEFTFTVGEAGDYQLVVSHDTFEIVVSPIQIEF